MPEVLVLYYSRGGSVAKLARQVARGIDEVEGMTARLRTVPPVAAVTQVAAPSVPEEGAPYVEKHELAESAGLRIGGGRARQAFLERHTDCEAIAARRALGDNGSVGLAATLHQLGSLLWRINDPAGADGVLTEALAIREKILGPDRVRYIHPDCGFWMLKRSVADRKIAALAKGRDLYLARR